MKKKVILLIFIVVTILLAYYFTNRHYSDEITLGDSNVIGDIDGNGKVGTSDYILVRKHLLKTITLKGNQLSKADANGDNKVNALDYILIRKIILSGNSESNISGTVIDKGPIIMIEGSEKQIKFDGNISWTSSNSSVVSVNQNGKIMGNSGGRAKITAKTSSVSSTDIDVLVYAKGVSVVETFSKTKEYIIADYNVLAYGADPTGEKDSTEAFRKALKAASDGLKTGGKGGTVFVPKGRYKITKQLVVDRYVGLIGDLKEGTTEGTVLMLYYGSGSDDYNNSAIKVGNQGAIKNMAFYYPEQTGNGNIIKYPPTILSTGHDGLTLENITFVNSYIAIDMGSNSGNQQLPFVSDIYGTPLKMGIISNMAYDVPRISNINFNSSYWINNNLGVKPDANYVKNYLTNPEIKSVGIALEKADWFYLTNIKISDYYIGITLRDSTARTTNKVGNAEGQMYDVKITNCTFAIYDSSSRHIVITNSTLNATVGNALYIGDDTTGTDISINSSTLSSNREAIYNGGKNNLSITGSTINGTIMRRHGSSKISFVNTSLNNTGYDGSSWTNNDVKLNKDFTYTKSSSTIPKSNALIVLDVKENEDITNKLNSAINSLSSTGGIVYIPSGVYYITSHIDVKSGIEIRGSIPWAHYTNDNRYEGEDVKKYHITWIKSNYKDSSLFTLYGGAGINGLNITNQNLIDGSIESYPYLIQGNGSNIYIKNVTSTSASKGIDLFTYQNNNHYVENLLGEFFEVGIKVGGNSSNGLIKNCHFNPNVMTNKNWTRNFNYIMDHQISFEIGNSLNEVLVGNFSYGSKVGHKIINGAKNFVILGSGSDYSKEPLQINGNINGELINPLLTTIPNTASSNCSSNDELYCGNNPSDEHYIKTNDSFEGYVNIVNFISWLNNSSTAFYLNGTGDIHLYGGIIDNSNHQTIILNNKYNTIIGLIINQNGSPEFIINPSVSNTSLAGNICVDGTCEVHNGNDKTTVNAVDGIK